MLCQVLQRVGSSDFVRRSFIRFQSSPPRIRRNLGITGVDKVLLIDQNGEQVGQCSVREAFQRAQEAKLDLVEVAPKASPPVCKIMDFGKHLYDLKKAEKAASEHARSTKIKEVKLGTKIEEHDFGIKMASAKRFLKEGHPVRITVTAAAPRSVTPAEKRALAEQLLAGIQRELAAEGEMAPERLARGNDLSVLVHVRKPGKETTTAAAAATTSASKGAVPAAASASGKGLAAATAPAQAGVVTKK